MKILALTSAAFLLLALIDLPIGYDTFLRIFVTIGSLAVIVEEFKNGFNFWVVSFAITAILFNPLMPIYFNDKEAWMPIDITVAVIFIIKSLTIKLNKDE